MSGFEHKKTYMIQNLIDGMFMDLNNSSTATGTPIIGCQITNKPSQRWTAIQEGYGFRLTSQLDTQHTKALDQGPGGSLTLWDFHGGPNQLWVACPLFSATTFLIASCRDKNAIQYQGPGRGLACVPANDDDRLQYWMITEII